MKLEMFSSSHSPVMFIRTPGFLLFISYFPFVIPGKVVNIQETKRDTKPRGLKPGKHVLILYMLVTNRTLGLLKTLI